MTPSATEALIRIGIEEILEAVGLDRMRTGRWLLERLCLPAARRFAREVADYDRRVGDNGLYEGARFLLERNVAGLEAAGQENVPVSGPLLLVANHPGLADAMSIFSSLPRTDLLTVAADRPFLRALHHTSKHLIYLGSREDEQGSVLRRVAGHLRQGGAALIFPGGRIEPDPDLLPGAADSLDGWSKSIGLIVRLVSDVRVVPVIVRGVLSNRAARHPLTRLRRLARDRERLAAVIQLMLPAFRSVRVRVSFGEPLEASELLTFGSDAKQIADRIIDHTKRLIESPPDRWMRLAGPGVNSDYEISTLCSEPDSEARP